jgi:hypothetical protein
MSDEKTLKRENLIHIRGYLVANILIFWLLAGLKFGDLMKSLEVSFGKITDKVIESIVLSALLYIGTVVICGLLSSNFKYTLIFWRWQNPLPGTRVFTHLMSKDPRIDTKSLEQRYAPLPNDPADQNRLWYKLYKKHEHDKSVLEAQKHFLLTRELNSISFLSFFVLGTTGHFIFSNRQLWILYLIGLLVAFLITAIAAQNYGSRFATNVLAIESATNTPT